MQTPEKDLSALSDEELMSMQQESMEIAEKGYPLDYPEAREYHRKRFELIQKEFERRYL